MPTSKCGGFKTRANKKVRLKNELLIVYPSAHHITPSMRLREEEIIDFSFHFYWPFFNFFPQKDEARTVMFRTGS